MRIIETCPTCGHDLINIVIDTYPPIPRKECFNCGWSWEGTAEEVVRVPFSEDQIPVQTVRDSVFWDSEILIGRKD